MFDDMQIEDRIYEAAVVPELWPEVLGQLSKAMDGAGGLLFAANAIHSGWAASDDIRDTFVEFIRDGWAEKNLRPVRLGASNHAGFVRDNDHFTQDELDNDPVYRDFYRKRGLGWATGTMLNVPSGDSIIFSFERAYAKGPVPLDVVHAFDRLRPHLARSALLASRLGLDRARAMADALQSLGLPTGVVDRQGRLMAANGLLDALVPNTAQDRPHRITLTDPAADAVFETALARMRSSPEGTGSIPIAAVAQRSSMIVHLIPVRGAANDIFSRAMSLLVITPVDRATVPTAHVLQGLFDLTPAEARVARAIGEAQKIEAIAAALGVSRETVRSQLKSVLSKTGLSRQQELISLLAGKTLPLPGPRQPD